MAEGVVPLEPPIKGIRWDISNLLQHKMDSREREGSVSSKQTGMVGVKGTPVTCAWGV